jgi:hypothetical protein
VQYIKNIAFTKLIKVNGVLREFNFRRKYVSGEPVYDIDASDDRGNRHYVSAHRINNAWVIREIAVPDWIREAAPGFHTAIEEQEVTAA